MAWRVLSTAPRVAVAPALFDPDVCARLVAAARPYFDRPEVSSSSSSYQTRPAASCGDEVMTILRGANIIQAAETATGIAYRPGEDIVIARTSCAATPQYSNGDMHLSGTLFSSVHHDRNNAGNGGERAATFMVYLTTIAAGNGGETFFPALNSSVEEDPVARALEASYLAERRILELESSLSVKCEELLVRWRRGGGGDGDGGDGGGGRAGGGGGVHCEAGKAVVFGASCKFGSWHAPCSVGGGTEDKWIVSFFKAPQKRFSGMMIGL